MVELGAVGCTSLIGADAAEGRCPNSPTVREPRLEELSVDDEVRDELGIVGCTVVSGKPLDGSSHWLVSWLLGS